jgi:hypothetical protein
LGNLTDEDIRFLPLKYTYRQQRKAVVVGKPIKDRE